MQTVTFADGALRVTVRSSIGRDELNAHIIAAKLKREDEWSANYRLGRFTDIVSQTVQIDGWETLAPRGTDGQLIPFPDVTADADTLRAWEETILNQPKRLMKAWLKALNEVEIAPGEDVKLTAAAGSSDPNSEALPEANTSA